MAPPIGCRSPVGLRQQSMHALTHSDRSFGKLPNNRAFRTIATADWQMDDLPTNGQVDPSLVNERPVDNRRWRLYLSITGLPCFG
jgi:hypothetical protein